MFFYEIFKRGIDLFGAFFGLILATPLLFVFAILIKLETPGPFLYKQERMGKNQKIFMIYKLRSMYMDAETDGPLFASEDDNRVTKVGKFMRKTRIDEIPQFLNVFKGELSLVGPRPERPNFTYRFNEEIPGFIKRLQIKPGITGLAQIMGGYDLSPERKLAYDLKYIDNRSLCLDFKILLKTIYVVLTFRGW